MVAKVHRQINTPASPSPSAQGYFSWTYNRCWKKNEGQLQTLHNLGPSTNMTVRRFFQRAKSRQQRPTWCARPMSGARVAGRSLNDVTTFWQASIKDRWFWRLRLPFPSSHTEGVVAFRDGDVGAVSGGRLGDVCVNFNELVFRNRLFFKSRDERTFMRIFFIKLLKH